MISVLWIELVAVCPSKQFRFYIPFGASNRDQLERCASVCVVSRFRILAFSEFFLLLILLAREIKCAHTFNLIIVEGKKANELNWRLAK